MRHAVSLVISMLPLMAQVDQGPVSARIPEASVLFGPGIIQDRSGEQPVPRFEPKLAGSLQMAGLAPRAKPRFRFWLVKAGDEEKLKRISPRSLEAQVLSSNAGIKTSSGYSFEMRWVKGSVDPEDRLFVEVFLGRRRAATAISRIQSHFLPASPPKSQEENN